MDEVQNVVVQNVVVDEVQNVVGVLKATWARIKTLEAKQTRRPNDEINRKIENEKAAFGLDVNELYTAVENMLLGDAVTHANAIVVDDAMSDAYAEMRDDLDRLYLAELESTCNAIVADIKSG
jgi:hypothetical protein